MGLIASTNFTLSDEAVLFAVLEKQFGLSRATLVITSSVASVPVRNGIRDRNRQLIHDVLPAGNYTLSLYQSWSESIVRSHASASRGHLTSVSSSAAARRFVAL